MNRLSSLFLTACLLVGLAEWVPAQSSKIVLLEEFTSTT